MPHYPLFLHAILYEDAGEGVPIVIRNDTGYAIHCRHCSPIMVNVWLSLPQGNACMTSPTVSTQVSA